MAKKDIEFKVGVIILLGIIVLAGSLYWLRDYQLEHNSKIVRVLFDDIGSLAVGDKVTVAGVRVGKVINLSLREGGVVVDLLLSTEINIRKDSRFIIKNIGLMGERFIAIKPGQDTTNVDNGHLFQGEYDTGLPEVMGLMGDMMVDLRSLVQSFKQTIGSDSSLNSFNETIANLENVSKSLADYLKRNESKLDQTADNFLSASNDLKNMMSNNSQKIDSTTARFDRISMQLEDFIGQLDTLAGSFRQFADNINNPEGTLQLLTEDRRLYDDLRKTADNIDDLITDIKENPQKYINIKVELF